MSWSMTIALAVLLATLAIAEADRSVVNVNWTTTNLFLAFLHNDSAVIRLSINASAFDSFDFHYAGGSLKREREFCREVGKTLQSNRQVNLSIMVGHYLVHFYGPDARKDRDRMLSIDVQWTVLRNGSLRLSLAHAVVSVQYEMLSRPDYFQLLVYSNASTDTRERSSSVYLISELEANVQIACALVHEAISSSVIAPRLAVELNGAVVSESQIICRPRCVQKLPIDVWLGDRTRDVSCVYQFGVRMPNSVQRFRLVRNARLTRLVAPTLLVSRLSDGEASTFDENDYVIAHCSIIGAGELWIEKTQNGSMAVVEPPIKCLNECRIDLPLLLSQSDDQSNVSCKFRPQDASLATRESLQLLHVRYKPVFFSKPSMMKVQMGTEFTAECVFRSNPPAQRIFLYSEDRTYSASAVNVVLGEHGLQIATSQIIIPISSKTQHSFNRLLCSAIWSGDYPGGDGEGSQEFTVALATVVAAFPRVQIVYNGKEVTNGTTLLLNTSDVGSLRCAHPSLNSTLPVRLESRLQIADELTEACNTTSLAHESLLLCEPANLQQLLAMALASNDRPDYAQFECSMHLESVQQRASIQLAFSDTGQSKPVIGESSSFSFVLGVIVVGVLFVLVVSGLIMSCSNRKSVAFTRHRRGEGDTIDDGAYDNYHQVVGVLYPSPCKRTSITQSPYSLIIDPQLRDLEVDANADTDADADVYADFSVTKASSSTIDCVKWKKTRKMLPNAATMLIRRSNGVGLPAPAAGGNLRRSTTSPAILAMSTENEPLNA